MEGAGFDHFGLGGVSVAEEIDAGHHYDITLGAIAARLRRRFNGEMCDEMLDERAPRAGTIPRYCRPDRRIPKTHGGGLPQTRVA